MKKLLLLGALAITGLFNAQGLKGTWFATAQVGYQQIKTGNASASNTTILPIVGTFVAPTTAVGVAVGHVGIVNKTGSVEDSNVSLLVVEPLVRKYWNVAGSLYFFGQLAAPVISGKENKSETKVSQYGLAMSGGLDYVLTKNFTVEFSYNLANLSVSTVAPKVGDATTVTDFSLAHVATVNPQFDGLTGASPNNLITPLSFGFKFLF